MPEDLLSIRCENASNRALGHHAVTYGVPLAEGALAEPEGLSIRAAAGRLLPVQTRALERHADGSVAWLLLDFAVDIDANEKCELALTRAECAPDAIVQIHESDERITATTPQFSMAINKRRFSLFESYTVGGREMVAPGWDIVLEMPKGKRYCASAARKLDVRVVERGPLRVVIQASGRHTAGDGSEMFDFRVLYTVRAHEPGVELAYKFTNAEPPETGVKVGSISIVLPTAVGPDTTRLVRQTNHGADWYSRLVAAPENVEITAAGAVNEAAKTRYGSAADGKVVIRNLDSLHENLADYPYFLRPGNARTDMTGGLAGMYPYVGVAGEGGSAVAWFCEMSQNFPKGLRSEGALITWDVWPAWAGELHWRRGMAKEHRLYICLSDARLSHEALEGVYLDRELIGMGLLGVPATLVRLTLDVDYARSTRVLDIHRWLRHDPGQHFLVEDKLGSLDAAGDQGQIGMMDYSDHVSADRSWSQNNENDAILNHMREYYRRADAGQFATALAKARHNAHVDFIAHDPDPLRQGTMPAHCPEHTDGASYPSHMWVDGLLAAYCASGEEDLRVAALAVGEALLRWQKGMPVIFYADSRECGWPMLAFLRLHLHTGEQRWLDACEEVFLFYLNKVNDDAQITYELPHGVGQYVGGYGEFIAWRACFFYYERTGREDVKEFLVRCLDKVYLRKPSSLYVGWGANDLFPAWAAFALTGEDRYIEDNYPFLRLLMRQPGAFPWGGVDMHYYLNELDRRGTLGDFED